MAKNGDGRRIKEIVPTITIPIGPIHPALKEPVNFRITVEGEEIVDVDIRSGYNHRGIEWLGLRRNWIQNLYLAERICGICSWAHCFCYIQAAEDACNIEVPERADFIRVVISELERIQSHLLWVGIAGHEIGYDTILHITWQVREKIMDLFEFLTGNRVNYAMGMIGGVRRDIEERHILKIDENLKYYKEAADQLIKICLHDKTIEKRMKNCGILPRKDALELSILGPTARGSGVRKDVRQDEGYAAYGDIGVKAVVPDDILGRVTGDVFDRTVVRVVELKQSIEIIENALDMMPSGPVIYEEKPMKLIRQMQKESGEGIGMHEAPRGELIQYIRADASDKPARWKIRAPSMNNLLACRLILLGGQIADIPIVVASIDPCFSCTDRVTIVERDEKTQRRVDDLKCYSKQK